jgi:hypothetical protein
MDSAEALFFAVGLAIEHRNQEQQQCQVKQASFGKEYTNGANHNSSIERVPATAIHPRGDQSGVGLWIR